MRRRASTARLVAALLVVVTGAAGCGGTTPAAAPTQRSEDTAARTEVVVFAAASLTDALGEVDDAFRTHRPDLVPRLNLAGSQQLATQIVQGAPADVFVSADPAQMDTVVSAGLVAGDPATVATNRLAIAVEHGNPKHVTALADLARSDVTVVLGAAEVPAGRYAREILDRAGVHVDPVSLEPDVRSVLAKVRLGEADAAIVYASDVVDAGPSVDGIPIPDAQNVVATYPGATLRDAPHPDAAAAYLDFLRSTQAQHILAQHGFGGAGRPS